MSDKLKKGAKVLARTVHSDKSESGKIVEVRQGQKGAWYSVKLDSGSTINTRAACIEVQ